MDLFQSMQISASGLAAQRIRMNVIASNLANINTTKTPEGGPYRRKDVYFRPIEVNELGGGSDVARARISFKNELERELRGVEISRVVKDQKDPRLVYNPSHPDANDKGYVSMPNINMITEVVTMMNAQRSYEANVTAINATKAMINKSMAIGR
ncbi:MAG TPA: flagellar basal body rod protein FlgC [Nitrospinae bacterium]|nr:flagellar basal body rod protein FlgC [Nitrospinota bacterium]